MHQLASNHPTFVCTSPGNHLLFNKHLDILQTEAIIKEKDPVFCCIYIPYMALVMSGTK